MRRMTALVLSTMFLLVTSAGPAAAHAKLESMSPADGSTLADPPKSVVLRFSEPVGRNTARLVVRSPTGSIVSTGAPAVVDATVTQSLGALTEAGRYQVSGRVVSGDGHPITVTGTFTVTRPARSVEPVPARPSAASTPVDGAAAERTPEDGASAAGTPDDGASARVVIFTMVLVMLVVVALAVVIVRRRPVPEAGRPMPEPE